MNLQTSNPRLIALAILGLGLGSGFSALVLAGSAPEAPPVGIPDSGPVVAWGIIVVRWLSRLVALVAIGLLLTAAVLLPNDGTHVRGLAARAVQYAGRWALVWVATSAALLVFVSADLFGRDLRSALDAELLWNIAWETDLGRGMLYQVVIGLLIWLLSRWVTSIRLLIVTVGVAVTALIPSALSGHAAAAGSHDLAVISLAVHLIAVSFWVGGLLGLLWVGWNGSARLSLATSRFSTIAVWSVAALAISGAVNALVRFGSISGIMTNYGALVVVKTALLIVLVVLGAVQRRVIVARIGDGPAGVKTFSQLAALEIAIMSIAMAVAGALARTAPPAADEVLLTPGEQLLGRSMPPAPDFWSYLWGWYPSGLGLLLVGFGVGGYVAGYLLLRQRGVRWPIGRVLSWMFGMLLVAWATLGGLGVYSSVLFSAHMVAHMILSMVAPIFLVLGAPMTMALRVLPGPRREGELSPRKLLNEFLHSRFSRIVTHPVVAATLFVGSLYAVYFTNLFSWLMRNHWGHVGMELHFLAAGFLFYYVIIGVDPTPRRIVPLARFMIVLVTVPFHAFFSIALMGSSQVVARDYYEALARPYATDLLADQTLGAGIAWGMGEVPLAIVMIALFVQWFRTDRRESRRLDRAADRDDDAELRQYNEYLAQLNKRT